ncbi:unnamed protein product [Ilex paraguariensis]|uniref:glyceraldehyde-3-phosphate dehydrogenase (NADP(+)) (phosphorylating) n=1 Tax=Ilex paraguariensis TaxID=185542 RepID=A0ABC8T6W7_9AQUA
MATHAALASSRIPTRARVPSKTSHSFPTQGSSKCYRLEVAEFSGLRSSSCVTVANNARDTSFFDAVAAQLTPVTAGSTPAKGETVAKLKVAINGFGRIGRNFLRCWHSRKDSPLEVVVVNDSGGVEGLQPSHLLKYDSMLGTFKAEVKVVDNKTISVDGKPIKVVSNRDPLKLPWADLGIDIFIEGTGVFVDGPGAGKHTQAGAKKVIFTAPAKGADSNASCTTNCLAPFVKVIDEEFGIVKGTMTATHSYTGDRAGAKKVIITAPAKGADIPTYVVGVNAQDYDHQVSNIVRLAPRKSSSLLQQKVLIGVNAQDYDHEVSNIVSNASCTTNCLAPFVKRLLDASHLDLRRARAATLNIVPTSTGAAKDVSLVLPQLKGKLNGIALQVPTPNVSVVDLVVNVEKKGITAEDVNTAFRKAAEGPLKGILDVCDISLVSIDFRCTNVSSTIDFSLSMVMGDDMVKVVAWYDNDWGYSQQVVDLAHLVASKWPDMPVQGSGDPY